MRAKKKMRFFLAMRHRDIHKRIYIVFSGSQVRHKLKNYCNCLNNSELI